jgi:hypothetical protein
MITSGAVPAPLHHHRRVTRRHTQDHDFADPLQLAPSTTLLATGRPDQQVTTRVHIAMPLS